MRRPGKIIAVVIGLIVFAPAGSQAQQAGRIATVGVLSPGSKPGEADMAFEPAMAKLGWRSAHNVRFEARYSGGRSERLDPLATELVRIGVDVLVAWGGPAAAAAKRATTRIPIVFLAVGDPIRFGLVSSLARPESNATGVTFDTGPDIDVKRLELLKEVVPGLARVALLVPSDTPRRKDTTEIATTARQALTLDVREIPVRAPVELAAAIRRAKEEGAQALSVWSVSPQVWRKEHSDLAIALRLPSIHWFSQTAVDGGLLSYSSSLTDIARRGTLYVDRILRGAKPEELPVEQPNKYDLVVNLKTAKALGVRIPPSLVLRADKVLE